MRLKFSLGPTREIHENETTAKITMCTVFKNILIHFLIMIPSEQIDYMGTWSIGFTHLS